MPLDQGALILTPNNRLKNKLLLTWAAQQPDVRKAPNIHSFSDWIESAWLELQRQGEQQALKIIASTPVRRQLWAQALQLEDDVDPLVHPRLLIDQLDQAYSYLKLWQVSAEQWQSYGQVDEQRRLTRWIDHVEREADSLGLMFDEQRLAILLEAKVARPQPAHPVYLLNFDTLAPLHRKLLNASFAELIPIHSNSEPAQQTQRLMCKDPKQELQAAAEWAFNALQADPSQRIAIVDPNLGKNRARLERALARVFEPSHHRPTSPRFTMPFNFSAGTPLAQCPLVHQLLGSLRWPKTQSQCIAWLNSPFIGHSEDAELRHWVSSFLQESGRAEVSLGHLEQAILAYQNYAGPAPAVQRWQDGLSALQDWPARATGREWAAHILNSLQQLNWPGPRVLDSEEHQQASQLLTLLDRLSEADLLNRLLSAADARHWLNELASRQPFQPQTPESPLQILGTLESAGLAFDQLWVLGMDDTQWPPPAAPNPLLPAALQRDLEMPHASADRELAFCQSLTRNFLCAARRVVFSHAARDGDRELNTSPLINHLPLLPDPSPEPPRWHQAPLEWLATHEAPAVSPAERVRLRGGSSMLQKQARCPLAAFMALRLGARRPAQAQPGLNALDRGHLLHQTLFYFWREQPSLAALDDAALEGHLQKALDLAIAELPALANTRFMALERERLNRLLRPWLALERDRPNFAPIGLEQALEYTLGDLPMSLRLDRIDSVGQQWLLIDYKSGASHIGKWLGTRPEEPQLPLYAVALADAGEPVAGIAFAELRQTNQSLQGIGNPQLSPGIKAPDDRYVGHEDWPELIEHWRAVLTHLANELLEGHTPLAFSSPQSQQYAAELAPLLRTSEQPELLSKGIAS